MPPAVIGGAIAGVGGIAGSVIGSNAASSAADKQAAAARDANQMQWNMFQQQRADQDPWRQAGMQALYGNGGFFRRTDGGSGMATTDTKTPWMDKRMAELRAERDKTLAGLTGPVAGLRDKLAAQMNDDVLRGRAENDWTQSGLSASGVNAGAYEIDPELTRSFTNADFQKDPGYDFRMQEGTKALERSAAARGGLNSGATMKALSRYGQDYASNEYQNAYNRFTNNQANRFNRLSALAGIGQTANAQIGQAGMNYANQAGGNLMGAANAAGAAGVASANMWGQTLGSLGKNAMDYGAMQQWGKQWNQAQGG